jgi:fumarate hydratase subunit beta
VIGAAGPTTSYRMDPYAPALMERGLKVMIGKGKRTEDVKEAMVRLRAVYLAAIGGAGALMARCIKEAEVIAYPDLGPEAVRRLVVREMPLICVNDTKGGDLYQTGRAAYQR